MCFGTDASEREQRLATPPLVARSAVQTQSVAQGASTAKEPVMGFLDYPPSSASQVTACSNLWNRNLMFRKLLF